MIVTPQKTTKYCITDSSNAETPVIRQSARAYGRPSCRLRPVGSSCCRQRVADDGKPADAPPDHRRQSRQHIPVSRAAITVFSTYATSHTTGVVPTALNTTYVSANTRLGAQARPASSVSSSDVSAVAKTISGTVYYTDDHYPPYYAKAHKITPVYKRRTNTCCQ